MPIEKVVTAVDPLDPEMGAELAGAQVDQLVDLRVVLQEEPEVVQVVDVVQMVEAVTVADPEDPVEEMVLAVEMEEALEVVPAVAQVADQAVVRMPSIKDCLVAY